MTGTNGSATPTRARSANDLASAVHELRAPLTTVQGILETLVLRGEALPDEVRAHIAAVALRNARILGERIDTLLQGARPPDRTDLAPAPLDLAAAVARTVEDNGGTLADHRIVVEVPETWVRVDERALAHVLANLLGNAAKHSPAGSRITVRAAGTGDPVALQVADHGEGIHPDDLPHVFEPWFRGRSPVPGTGLGLWVAEDQVHRWGGDIEITSTRGEGTVVTFTLPAATTATTAADHTGAAGARGPEG